MTSLERAARAVVDSEVVSLRNRVGDGYAVIEIKKLDRLKAALNPPRRDSSPRDPRLATGEAAR
jgi:hypothetical protein